jgi:SP family general alpha glucoside:H+ symporter-like MFS transporter
MASAADKDGLGHVENAGHLEQTQSQAVEQQLGHLANQEEHDETKFEALRNHPIAACWCLYAAVCVLLAAFENQASGSILSIPEFRKDFGYAVTVDGVTSYTLSSQWQGAFQGAPVAT